MGAHWVINVYIALSAPVMPILASYWLLPRPIQPHGPRDGSHGPKRILGNPEKYRWPRNSEKSLIGKIGRREAKACKGQEEAAPIGNALFRKWSRSTNTRTRLEEEEG